MRRQLMLTVSAVVCMVLLAMLVPMGVLLEGFAVEDRIARAGLEVQATETVVATSDDDRGDIAVYLATINEENPDIQTTVLYPDGTSLGPSPGEDRRVEQARRTGIARVDDIPGGAEILVPVAMGAGSAPASQTPVIRVEVAEPGISTGIYRVWIALSALGLVMLAGALVLADRLGRSFVQPLRALATYAGQLGHSSRPQPVPLRGPIEVRQLAQAINQLVDRIDLLITREREGVADLSHRLRTPTTALQLRIDALPESEERDRLAADLAGLRATVDQIVIEARRSEREGLIPESDATAVLSDRARFWEPLAEDHGRPFALQVSTRGARLVRASEADLAALLDVLLDNVFSYTPEGTAVWIRIGPRDGGGAILTVEDDGPGIPEDSLTRGSSDAGSTGLGLSIAAKTAVDSGGEIRLEPREGGGGRVVIELGPSR